MDWLNQSSHPSHSLTPLKLLIRQDQTKLFLNKIVLRPAVVAEGFRASKSNSSRLSLKDPGSNLAQDMDLYIDRVPFFTHN